MKIAYVRVSTVEQNEARQREALEIHGIDKWFVEKVSAKDTNRPKLQEMIDYIREGDVVYIHEFSRLARNTKDLLDIVEKIGSKHATLISNKEKLDSSTPTGKLMLTMIGAINEFERSILLERQKEGIAIAKREKKYKGRKKITVADFGCYYERYMAREVNKSQLAKELNVSRPTIDRLIEEWKQNE